MSVCTFFGHKYVEQKIAPLLSTAIVELIENQGVDTFFVGNNGSFDHMVKGELFKIKQQYPNIKYNIVLAHMPIKKEENLGYENTIYPSVLDGVPHRAKIVCRNEWMIEKSDFVITYVTRSIGGAAESKAKAEKKGKTIINLYKVEKTGFL